jgi:prephenate dehydrogenase
LAGFLGAAPPRKESVKYAKVAILGPGLLGGSLALALKGRKLAGEISIYGRTDKSLEGARVANVTSLLFTDPVRAVEGAELVVFSTPIGVMPELARQILPALQPSAIVTDVGSVKGCVVKQMESILNGRARWVGSHPMAGSEQAGFAAARADLFEKSVAIVTPTPVSDAAAVETVKEFWSLLGCRLITLEPGLHDQLVAQISHLPHLTAAALVQAASQESLALIGNGFRDTTRVAAGPPAMWTDILISNRCALEAALGRLISTLEQAREQLQKGDEKGLHELLSQANHVRSQLSPRSS